jgi:hypothetical protein
MRAGAFAAKIGFSLSLLFLASGNLHAQEETTPAQGDRSVAIEQGMPPSTGNPQHFYELWRQRWRGRSGKVSARATPLTNIRRPFAEAGACPGGCPGGASCCDCSKSLPPSPGCCITDCGAGFTACCIIGGTAGCIPAGTCCSDAECSGGQQCSRPGGTCSCPTGQTLCGGTCVDTKSDPSNCGACGSQCNKDLPTESKCCAGACVQCADGADCVPGDQAICACPPGQSTCAFESRPLCVDLKKGVAGFFCGTCSALPCGLDEQCCNGTCRNLNDPKNCGQCGNPCSQDASCCNGVCKDFDDANCGGCGIACAEGSACIKGACRPFCRTGERCDLTTGTCACAPRLSCIRGVCSRPQGP